MIKVRLDIGLSFWSSGKTCHVNIFKSRIVLMISSCSLRNEFLPSPYRRDRLSSKMPKRQYAMSSVRLVCLGAALENPDRGVLPCNSDGFMRVMADKESTKDRFVPKLHHPESKKCISQGAISSCKVQPRVNLGRLDFPWERVIRIGILAGGPTTDTSASVYRAASSSVDLRGTHNRRRYTCTKGPSSCSL
jgi:hypothetical protein